VETGGAAERLLDGGARFDLCVVDATAEGADAALAAAARAGVRALVVAARSELLALAGRRHPGTALLAKPFGPAEIARCLADGPPPAARAG